MEHPEYMRLQLKLIPDEVITKYNLTEKVDENGWTVSLSHVKHLKQALEKYYKVTVDWKGERFYGVKLDWDHKKRTVDLSLPNYIPKSLTRFQLPLTSKPQHAPYKAAPIEYGNKVQLAQEKDKSPKFSPDKIKYI
eukprot:CCRYP_005379-RA/>CCRYP_005379-RA protein AED:0.35 eAED:0.35 QI:0/0/0/1/1/1/2/0/135